MRTLAAVVVALAAAWLEVSLVAPLRPFGVVPNLVLVVMVLLAVNLAASTGLVLAAMVGLFLDLNSGSSFGMQTGFYLLVALSLSLLARLGTDLGNLSVMAGLVVAYTILIDAAVLAGLATSGASLHPNYIAQVVAIELVCNLVLLVVLRWVMTGLTPRLFDGSTPGHRRG